MSNKINVLELCNEIEACYIELDKITHDNERVIESNKQLLVITEYSMLTMGYLNEIAELQRHNLNTSIMPIFRCSLDCYSVIHKMKKIFGESEKFDNYFRFLILKDMFQDIKIYNELCSQDKVKDTGILRTFTDRFSNIIKTWFSESYNEEVHKSENIDVFWNFYKEQKKILSTVFNDNISSISNVGDAILDNKAWKLDSEGEAYPDPYSIYPELCHAVHNSISSIEERVIEDKIVKYNIRSKNQLGILSLALYTAKDIILSIKELIGIEWI